MVKCEVYLTEDSGWSMAALSTSRGCTQPDITKSHWITLIKNPLISQVICMHEPVEQWHTHTALWLSKPECSSTRCSLHKPFEWQSMQCYVLGKSLENLYSITQCVSYMPCYTFLFHTPIPPSPLILLISMFTIQSAQLIRFCWIWQIQGYDHGQPVLDWSWKTMWEGSHVQDCPQLAKNYTG